MKWLVLLVAAFIAVSGEYTDASADEYINQYLAEIYFVVEPQVIRNYMALGYDEATAHSNLNGDIEFFIDQINKYFKSMEREQLYLQIVKKRVDILDSEIFNSSVIDTSKNGVRGTTALRTFKQWLITNDMHFDVEYDIPLLWTGYDLLSSSGSTSITGYATSKSACRPRSAAAVVEYDGTQATAYTSAHELVHTLGSSHDLTYHCPSFLGYMMTSLLKTSNRYRWSFSKCSIDSIKTYIRRLDSRDQNCLLETSTLPDEFNIASQEGRDIMNVQNMCKRKKRDSTSYFCGFSSFYEAQRPRGDEVCQAIYCARHGSRSCTSVMPTEGMVCDPGKRCNRGKCQTAPSNYPTPSNLDSDCLFGDVGSGKIVGFRGTCAEYLAAKGQSKCYSYKVRAECCATCKARRTGLSDCEYGDHFHECANYTPEQICPNNRRDCCFTCKDFREKRSAGEKSEALPENFFSTIDDDEDDAFEEPTIVEEDEE